MWNFLVGYEKNIRLIFLITSSMLTISYKPFLLSIARKLIFALTANTFIICTTSAQYYVGFGASNLSSSSDYSAIDSKGGTGFTLYLGYEIAPTWLAELSVSDVLAMKTGPTEQISYPADKAEYGVISLNIRKNIWPLSERTWTPWVSTGLSYHHINWDTYFYQLEGFGVNVSGGLEFEMAKALRLRIKSAVYKSGLYNTYDDGPFDSSTLEFSASLVYAFSK